MRNIYLGPYLRCTPRTESITKRVSGCPNVACKSYASGIFGYYCQDCGTKIESVSRETQQDVPDTYAVSTIINEALSSLNGFCFSGDIDCGHLWLVNAKRPGQPREFGVDGCAVLSMNWGARDTELDWFLETFAAEMAILRESYNDKCEPHWGLIVSDE